MRCRAPFLAVQAPDLARTRRREHGGHPVAMANRPRPRAREDRRRRQLGRPRPTAQPRSPRPHPPEAFTVPGWRRRSSGWWRCTTSGNGVRDLDLESMATASGRTSTASGSSSTPLRRLLVGPGEEEKKDHRLSKPPWSSESTAVARPLVENNHHALKYMKYTAEALEQELGNLFAKKLRQ